jgi:3',5'-cyclic AMP phosphodiesterase CpdA
LLQTSGAAALAVPFTGFSTCMSGAQGAPLFRFGVLADPQYAPVPPRRARFYSHSLWKLSDAIEFFNGQDLQFVVTLGDIIDRHWESYDHILPIYDGLKHPYFFLLGNHDFEVAPDYLPSVLRVTGLKRAYYDFTGGGYRFVVLDGNEISLFANTKDSANYGMAVTRLAALTAANAPNAQSWNGGMSEDQFAWLKQTLDQAEARGEKIILFSHYPVYPMNEHNIWDDQRLVDLVSRYQNFVAFMNGHNHAGNYGSIGGKHFLNFKGMVETPAQTAYAVVEVYPDRLEVRGYGLEESRTLRIG